MSIYESLREARANFPTIVKNKTARVMSTKGGSYTYQYADIGDVLDAVVPVLAAHGLSLIQPIVMDGDKTILRTVICSDTGEMIESQMPLQIAGMAPQQVGATLTYYRRYALTSLIGVATEQSEDDAADTTTKNNKGGQLHGPLTITQLQQAMRSFASDLARVTDTDELSGLLLSSEPVLSQCRRDLQVWYYGQEGSDQAGAAKAIEEKRKELQRTDKDELRNV